MDIGNIIATLEVLSDEDRLKVACLAVRMVCRDHDKTGEPCNKCPTGGHWRCKEIHSLAEELFDINKPKEIK